MAQDLLIPPQNIQPTCAIFILACLIPKCEETGRRIRPMCDFRVDEAREKIGEVLPRVGKTWRDSSGTPTKHVFRSVTNLTGYRGSSSMNHPLPSRTEKRQMHACIWIIVGDRDPRGRENRFEIPSTVTYGVFWIFSFRQMRVRPHSSPKEITFFPE